MSDQEGVAKIREIFSELKSSPPRVTHRQEAHGKANCQFSGLEGSMAQCVRGNGNIQILCKELRLVSDKPMVINFNRDDGSINVNQLAQLQLIGPAGDAAPELSEAPAVIDALRTIRADTIQAIDGTVFRISASAMCGAFRGACSRAGITGFRWHDLRHTAASHMVMAGVPLRTVAEVLGHRSLQMIMRYAHLSPEHMREAVNTLGERLFAMGEKQV